MKAIHIDSAACTVADVEYAGLADVQRMLGGYLELGLAWASGDVLYLNDDARRIKQCGAFRLGTVGEPFVGNGVIVGCETEARTSSGYPVTADPVATAFTVGLLVVWGVWVGDHG